MTKYQKIIALTAASAVLGMSSGAFAQDDNQPAPPSQQIQVTSYNLDAVWAFDKDGNSQTKTYAGMELKMTDEFKIRAAAKLEALYDSVIDDKDFDWEEAVAQIQGIVTLNQVTGMPMVVIFGKSLQETIKPRLEAVKRSTFTRNQPDELDEVFAVGLTMEPAFLDSLSVTISETKGGDMAIDTDTVRMTVQAFKKIAPSIDAYGSVSYEKNKDADVEDAYAVSGGIVHDMDYLLDNLEAYGQVTHYQKGFGGLEDDTNVVEAGVNYNLNDAWSFTAGTEVSDSDLGRTYLNHIGATVALNETTEAYGDVTFKAEKFNGVEIGVYKKW